VAVHIWTCKISPAGKAARLKTLMVIYVLERFLARLEVSGYADRFVLKGGMLLAAWDARRATVDADFLVRNLNLDEDSVLRRVIEIAALPAPVEDGVEFRPDTVTANSIRDGTFTAGFGSPWMRLWPARL
jgi:hypothetical protein